MRSQAMRRLPFVCLLGLIAGVQILGLAVRHGQAGGDAQFPEGLEARARAAVSATRGRVKLAGLQHEVRVLRDHWGVPHIYAENQHDLFFAQGFVAAQDRLFQMELWKRAGQGRLAEVLGPALLPRDIKARLLRYRGPMTAEYSSYSPDTEEILEAFTAGINAYIRIRESPGGQGLPVEFQLAGFSPEPWKPEDCLTRMAGFPMTGNATAELYHAQLLATLGPEKTSRFLDLGPAVKLDPAPKLDFSGLSPDLLRDLAGSDSRLDFSAQAPIVGSNNWTVAGRLTRSGLPLLANDPHRTIALPSLRYIVHLVAPGWDVIGAGEPALPGVAVGHNQHIAWGFTVFGLDQQDLYVEELDSSDPLRYKTDEGWERVQMVTERVLIRGQASAEALLKFTRHGPVVWDDPLTHRALALRWVGMEPGTAGYLASLAVDRAQNWQQFLAAMERWKVPSENIVYADTEGNIGEQSAGLAPLRKNWTGLLPVPGTGAYEWAGFVPTAELPRSFNPAAGFIATANQRMIPEGYPYAVGFEWAAPFRARRIYEVLSKAAANGRKLDVQDMARLQNDVVSLPARELLRQVSAAGARDAPAQLLLHWDGMVRRDSAAAALYEIWLEELERAVFHRLAPQSAWKVVEGHWPLPLVLKYLSRPDVETFGPDPEAARDSLLHTTLAAAGEKLGRLQGKDSTHWSWGGLHKVRFRHPLDRLAGDETLLDLGPLARPGDSHTVNATGFVGSKFEQASGASYREIFDLSDWDRSLGVNVPGQSGQPGSAHYADLVPLWAEGQYFPLIYSRAKVEKESTEKLVLEPLP